MLFDGCNMGTNDLPEMYVLCRAQPENAGIKHKCPCYVKLPCNTSIKTSCLNPNTSVSTGFLIYACSKGQIMVMHIKTYIKFARFCPFYTKCVNAIPCFEKEVKEP